MNDFRTKRFLMKRDKYYFNTQTLRYEKVVSSPKMRLFKIAGFIGGVFVAAVIVVSLMSNLLHSSPKEMALEREIAQMTGEYDKLKLQIKDMGMILENIQERDASVHRMVFGMNPIDEHLWNGGTGGHDKNANLTNFKNTGKTLFSTIEKADRLAHQLMIQSRSLDEIEKMATNKGDEFASMPLIAPIQKDKLKRKIHLLSGFGKRLHPIYKVMKMHKGIDFTVPKGTPIQATGDGKIITAKRSPSYGRYVVIRHNDEYETLYAHMDKIQVKKGQKVKRGEQIGTVGNTGRSTAPHLHYEVHQKGRAINPIGYCIDGLSPTEYETLVSSASKLNQSLD